MEWIQTITKAVHYIENNLTNEISIEDVSKYVFTCSSNLQRIFNLVTGTTIGDYIRNRRLSLSGQDLLVTDIKVIDIAMRYQYDTSESFSKAFTRFHGIPPSVVKKQSDKLKFFYPFTINVVIQGGFNMSQINMLTFVCVKGEWNSYQLTENGLIAKKINGMAMFHFEKSDSKPSALKFESSSDKGDIHISIQYLKNGKKDNHPDNMETRAESTDRNGIFDLSELENGYYIIMAAAKNAENVSLRYELIC